VLLAIDTSTRVMGLAIYDGSRLLCDATWACGDHHTVELAPAIAEALQRCGLSISALQALGVAIGPGSFTGVRIGLALAKGMALAQHIPLVGVPTLDFLAASQPVQDIPLVAVLQAGRGRLAVGWYRAVKGAWQPQGSLEVLDALTLAERIQQPTRVCGELNEEERLTLGRKRKIVFLASPAQSLRRAGFLAELAWRRWHAGKVDDPVSLSPIYLHIGEPIPG
jgi:tRNA threonylcarbamoyladenosine biosynthesis protein TsaB